MEIKNKQEIIDFCERHGVNNVKMRMVKKGSGAKIVLSNLCSQCGQRNDISWDTLKRQVHPGWCVRCAAMERKAQKRSRAQMIVDKFAENEYKVITPLKKIKPKGKKKDYHKAVVTVETKGGFQFKINFNGYYTRRDFYDRLNEEGPAMLERNKKMCKDAVEQYLRELHIPYRRDYICYNYLDKFGNPVTYDFCLYRRGKRGPWIFVSISDMIRRYDKNLQRENTYKKQCSLKKQVPLLNLTDIEIERKDRYKTKIDNFLEKYKNV